MSQATVAVLDTSVQTGGDVQQTSKNLQWPGVLTWNLSNRFVVAAMSLRL